MGASLEHGPRTFEILIVFGLLLVGCSAVSPSTEKNTVRIVDVTREAVPRQVLVGQGVEVRWHNTSTAPNVIGFPASTANRLSCQRGFKYEKPLDLTTVIEPNSSASLCFANQGKYNYQVRRKHNRAGPFTDERAIVWVVGRGERNPDPYEEYTNITP